MAWRTPQPMFGSSIPGCMNGKKHIHLNDNERKDILF